MATAKRKRNYSNKVTYKRSKSTGQSLGTVPRTRGPTAAMQKSENHYFDTEREAFSGGVANSIISNTTSWIGTLQPPTALGRTTLFAPTLGNSIQDRTARTCWVKKIKFRGCVYHTKITDIEQGGAEIMPPIVRLLLVQDDQANGVPTGGAEIMRTIAQASTKNVFNTFQNLDNLGRFKVLKDKVVRFSDEDGWTIFPTVAGLAGNTNAPQRAKMIKFTHTFKKPVKVHFNAVNNNTVASIVAPSFGIYARDYNVNINQVYLDYCCRFVFMP